MPQLLHLLNSEGIVGKMRDPDGRLARLLRRHASDDPVLDELFLATLSRLPTSEQRARVRQALTGDGRDEGFRDLFWALLNTKEFAFNH